MKFQRKSCHNDQQILIQVRKLSIEEKSCQVCAMPEPFRKLAPSFFFLCICLECAHCVQTDKKTSVGIEVSLKATDLRSFLDSVGRNTRMGMCPLGGQPDHLEQQDSALLKRNFSVCLFTCWYQKRRKDRPTP